MNFKICNWRTIYRLLPILAVALVAVECRALNVPVGTQVFYAENDVSTISRQTLDGSPPQLLANTQRALLGLAVDSAGEKLYWSDNGQSFDVNARGRLYRSNLDGSGRETLYTAATREESVGQLQLNLDAQRIYWRDGTGWIRQMKMNGTGATTLSHVPDIGDALEFDPINEHLYFTTGTPGANTAKVERMNLDGSNRQVIANLYGYSLALDIANQNIYAADWFGQRLMRVGFDGTGITQIAKAPAIRDVQVFGGQLYFPNVRSVAPDNTGPYFFQWVRSGLDGSNPVTLYEVARAQGPQDMIQFVVVPEPSLSVFLLCILMIGHYRPARR